MMTTISKTITDFADALEATRTELGRVNSAIDALNSKRHGIVIASPHADDIAAVFLRGLAKAESGFETQFAARLKDTYIGPQGAEAVGQRKAPEVLRIDAEKLDTEALMSRSMRGQTQSDLNVFALAYFLRDRIAEELPSLIDRLCPAARDGMKQADREKALREVDAEIAELSAVRDRLTADIGAARAAVIR